MKVLIVLPVYNEELVLEKNTKEVLDFCQRELGKHQCKIVIADNNSSDGTLKLGPKLMGQYEEVDYFFTPKSGKGTAWRQVFLRYQADVYIVMDVDLAVELLAVKDLIGSIDQGYDLIVGSRYLKNSKVKRSFFRDLTSVVYRLMVRLILNTKISDFQCGFKAINNNIKKNILPQTKDDGFFLDTEITILAEKQGYRVKEISVDWSEFRDEERKSTVHVFQTIAEYLFKIWKLRKRVKK